MKYLTAALFTAVTAFAGAATAQNTPVVVELYTSQGCSSCPAADAIMHELAGREDVIALALHVDYWDYIGWKDVFADPAHAARQRAYAASGNRRSIYTPEMIVQGSTDIVGAKPMKLSEAIAAHAGKPASVTVGLSRQGDDLRITGDVVGTPPGVMTVHLLRYAPSQTTEIKRGENRGKTLRYNNIVEGWTELAEWDGSTPLDLTTSVSGDKPVVVIIQQQNAGPIMAAARLR
ncbi:DUF1223 domain containing protein [Sulfitobacter noctilucae]|uniref:DUF1223 domain-containing protein n=1 Tax=Sulfitobacter noctilucae TaxID=1342302 RepID=UPI00046944B4|nr:DUF1223 domain-containing protein [Sulfitobacter noctilucae]KIN60615.1 DUF1223 domain containing protein [Sulfitobacter noctilucae]